MLGDFERTGMYYDLLREEFKVCGSTASLTTHQLTELSHIRTALRSGVIARGQWTQPSMAIMAETAPAEVLQNDLVRLLHENCLGDLREILDDVVHLDNLEHPCPPYGRVDMVYRGTKTVYPVEVKKDCGDHDLVGQILKYDLYHRLRLHYKHYELVQSVTICRSYQQFALEELKRMGIVTLVYTGKGESLRKV